MPRRASRSSRGRSSPRAPMVVRYKVVELANVDEAALEAVVNEWVGQGWSFDGVQFAMRESSKRPSMGFVFFTREEPAAASTDSGFRSLDEARGHLKRLAASPAAPAQQRSASDAWARLAELAEGDGDGE